MAMSLGRLAKVCSCRLCFLGLCLPTCQGFWKAAVYIARSALFHLELLMQDFFNFDKQSHVVPAFLLRTAYKTVSSMLTIHFAGPPATVPPIVVHVPLCVVILPLRSNRCF